MAAASPVLMFFSEVPPGVQGDGYLRLRRSLSAKRRRLLGARGPGRCVTGKGNHGVRFVLICDCFFKHDRMTVRPQARRTKLHACVAVFTAAELVPVKNKLLPFVVIFCSVDA